jgi:hypothetical protein
MGFSDDSEKRLGHVRADSLERVICGGADRPGLEVNVFVFAEDVDVRQGALEVEWGD